MPIYYDQQQEIWFSLLSYSLHFLHAIVTRTLWEKGNEKEMGRTLAISAQAE